MENRRLESLDTLRGFNMMFIMGFAAIVIAVCNLFPDCCAAEWIASQMTHVKWDGLRHHDTIFPLFLFIAGVAFPFSYAKSTSMGISRPAVYRKIIIRTILLVAFGIIYNGFFRLKFDSMRFASVLGRIGIAWMFAAIIFINFRTATRAVVAVLILVGYWLATALIPVPGVAEGISHFSQEGCLAGYLDRLLLPGRMYYGDMDPEGIFGIIPAIVTAMLGMFTGEFVLSKRTAEKKKAVILFVAGICSFIVGYFWNMIYPINKSLWSSSFVMAVGGYSLIMFAIFYYIIDVKGWRKWTTFFKVIGMNSITIYMAMAIIDFRRIAAFFLRGTAELCPEQWGQLIMAVGYFMVCWLFLYFLYKKKVFLKI